MAAEAQPVNVEGTSGGSFQSDGPAPNGRLESHLSALSSGPRNRRIPGLALIAVRNAATRTRVATPQTKRASEIHAPLFAEAVEVVKVGDAVAAVDWRLFLVPLRVGLAQAQNAFHPGEGDLDSARAGAHR